MFSLESRSISTMDKCIKIQIDVSAYESVEVLKEVRAITEITNIFISDLEKNGYRAKFGSIFKATKNAVSLLLSRKKRVPLSMLTIYAPKNSLEIVDENVITAPSSNDVGAQTNCDDNQNQTRSSIPLPSFVSSRPAINFSMDNDVLQANVNFDYLSEYFKYSLSSNKNSMNIKKILDDVFEYVFVQVKCSVNVRSLKQEMSRQISRLVRSARISAGDRSVIQILREKKTFLLTFKSLIRLELVDTPIDLLKFERKVLSDMFILIFMTSGSNSVVQMHLEPKRIVLTFNSSWIENTLRSFESTRVLDTSEFFQFILKHCSKAYMNLDLTSLEETIKSVLLLLHRTKSVCNFITVTYNVTRQHQNYSNERTNSLDNELECATEEILNKIIGRTYETRGVKHSYEEDPISIDIVQNKRRKLKKMKDKRDLLHLKDTFHLSDSALNAIFRYIQQKKKIYSLREIELLRKETNTRFPIISTKTSAFVEFSHAVRTALFVAEKYEPNLYQSDQLNIRFNMDGTLIGNKHIVAISINCIEGGPHCQSAKNLVPLGLFEVQKENTEILRKSFPADFIPNIKALKYVSIGEKNIKIHLRLGGDLMNAVYVFGLAGFSSNFPCVFRTQHKDDLHVTEDTAYDKVVTEGKGRNRKISTVPITPTSCFDPLRKARSLAEQNSCLAKGSNELGYKSEPLFGDLFDYKDYVVDTLHLKLRVFDVILKDILSCASRTGQYGAEQIATIQKKIDVLNVHCERTVGKRFFFQIDSDDKNKTIASHGKLSGHLQDIFFVDSFPYEEILDHDTAQSARKVVNKFKEILRELKQSLPREKGKLKRLSLEFVKEFRKAGLRTTVTPYIHIIGNHLFEFDDLTNLSDYNMQGVEKNNDPLSRLYFSSTNPAKSPLRTMLQKLYRMLEMNFDEKDDMMNSVWTDVYDFPIDADNSLPDDAQPIDTRQGDRCDAVESISEESSTEEDHETDTLESMTWSPEKRFNIVIPHSKDPFKSFRRS